MAKKWGFIGPTYQLRSLNAGAERLINMYPEKNESTGEWSFQGTPGMLHRASIARGPVRALFAHNNVLYVVAADIFAKVDAAWTVTTIGTVRADQNPASISTNGDGGNQLLIISGKHGYIYNLSTEAFEEITDEDFPVDHALMAEFIEGFFIVLTDQNTFYLSALEDGLVWDGTDVNQRSVSPDPWAVMRAIRGELFLVGGKTGDVYYNSGDLDVPFLPVQGSLMDIGILAPYSMQRLDNTLLWLAGDERGGGIVVRAQGYTPARVSTHAIEYWLGQSSQLARATAFAYQQEGHTFYQLTVPDLETSWVYDVASQLWHERGHWNVEQMRYQPHRAGTHAYAFNKHVVGDSLTGGIYELSLEQFEDELEDAA
jgi:hypothetical protein